MKTKLMVAILLIAACEAESDLSKTLSETPAGAPATVQLGQGYDSNSKSFLTNSCVTGTAKVKFLKRTGATETNSTSTTSSAVTSSSIAASLGINTGVFQVNGNYNRNHDNEQKSSETKATFTYFYEKQAIEFFENHRVTATPEAEGYSQDKKRQLCGDQFVNSVSYLNSVVIHMVIDFKTKEAKDKFTQGGGISFTASSGNVSGTASTNVNQNSLREMMANGATAKVYITEIGKRTSGEELHSKACALTGDNSCFNEFNRLIDLLAKTNIGEGDEEVAKSPDIASELANNYVSVTASAADYGRSNADGAVEPSDEQNRDLSAETTMIIASLNSRITEIEMVIRQTEEALRTNSSDMTLINKKNKYSGLLTIFKNALKECEQYYVRGNSTGSCKRKADQAESFYRNINN